MPLPNYLQMIGNGGQKISSISPPACLYFCLPAYCCRTPCLLLVLKNDLDELKNLFHISSCCPTVNQNATLIPCLLRSGGRLRMSSFISPPVSVSPLILLPGPVCTAHFSRMILMSLRISSIYPPVCTSVCLLTAAGLPLFLFHVFKNDLDDFQDLFHISSCRLPLLP